MAVGEPGLEHVWSVGNLNEPVVEGLRHDDGLACCCFDRCTGGERVVSEMIDAGKMVEKIWRTEPPLYHYYCSPLGLHC